MLTELQTETGMATAEFYNYLNDSAQQGSVEGALLNSVIAGLYDPVGC